MRDSISQAGIAAAEARLSNKAGSHRVARRSGVVVVAQPQADMQLRLVGQAYEADGRRDGVAEVVVRCISGTQRAIRASIPPAIYYGHANYLHALQGTGRREAGGRATAGCAEKAAGSDAATSGPCLIRLTPS